MAGEEDSLVTPSDMTRLFWLGAALGTTAVLAQGISSCPGYAAANVKHYKKAITADLTLDGSPCNAYGNDIKDLKLLVEHQTGGYWLINQVQ